MKSPFLNRVLRVVNRQAESIIEHGGGFFKANLVFLLIGLILNCVPSNSFLSLVHGGYRKVLRYLYSHSLTSTKCPRIAAAAAIAGLTRCVRPPRPCRPSKFLLLVDAQRSPSSRMSGFIPRHIEQPASRHSKPAPRKTSSSPSASALALTCWEPGTTIARTEPATVRPSTTSAASRRSSIRELVQEPMKTRSGATSVIGVPAARPM